MDVFDAGGSIDLNKLIEYIAKDFPGEFKQILSARDELATRQGAIGAAEAAAADRKLAAQELAAAYNQAQQIVIDADARQREVDENAKALKAAEKAFAAKQKAADEAAAAKDAELRQREVKVQAREEAFAEDLANYDADVAALEADKAALAARVKSFQEKVAALNA